MQQQLFSGWRSGWISIAGAALLAVATQTTLLPERATLFQRAARPLGLASGEVNNVSLATNMTYTAVSTC